MTTSTLKTTYKPPNSPDRQEDEIQTDKANLSDLINETLRRNPDLSYFQGYHDICQVFLLVLGDDQPLRTRLVGRLSLLRIRDFMLPTLAATVAQLNLLPDILAVADPALRRHVAGIEPYYALAGVLTMYAHDIRDYGSIAGIRHDLPILPPQPNDARQWVDTAMRQNLQLLAAGQGVNAAQETLRQRRAGHLPTVDAVARYSHSDNDAVKK